MITFHNKFPNDFYFTLPSGESKLSTEFLSVYSLNQQKISPTSDIPDFKNELAKINISNLQQQIEKCIQENLEKINKEIAHFINQEAVNELEVLLSSAQGSGKFIFNNNPRLFKNFISRFKPKINTFILFQSHHRLSMLSWFIHEWQLSITSIALSDQALLDWCKKLNTICSKGLKKIEILEEINLNKPPLRTEGLPTVLSHPVSSMSARRNRLNPFNSRLTSIPDHSSTNNQTTTIKSTEQNLIALIDEAIYDKKSLTKFIKNLIKTLNDKNDNEEQLQLIVNIYSHVGSKIKIGQENTIYKNHDHISNFISIINQCLNITQLPDFLNKLCEKLASSMVVATDIDQRPPHDQIFLCEGKCRLLLNYIAQSAFENLQVFEMNESTLDLFHKLNINVNSSPIRKRMRSIQ